MESLKEACARKGIKLTPHGYILNGKFYPIADWNELEQQFKARDPLTTHITHWLKAL